MRGSGDGLARDKRRDARRVRAHKLGAGSAERSVRAHMNARGEEGGARHAFADTPYDSAGKTGTAQLFTVGQNEKYDATKIDERLRDNAMYVGFAPFNDPEISVTVVLENVGGGSKNAAPVARQIMDFYFRDRVFETAEVDSANSDNELGTN